MTLTETAALTKKVFKFGGIGLGVFLILWIIASFIYFNLYLPNKPPEKAKPDLRFGVLPKINLPETKKPSSQFTYNLDTPTGDLPAGLPEVLPIFFIPQLGTNLLSHQKATSLAESLGFNSSPEILSPTQYKFIDATSGELIIDIATSNFRYRKNPPPEEGSGLLPDEAKVIADFKSFLSQKNLLPDQLKEGETKVIFEGSKTQSTKAQIFLRQNDIKLSETETYPLITSSFKDGYIKATVTNSREIDLKYPNLDYIFWPVDLNTFATYPLKPPQAAFSNLQSDKGVILQESPSSKTSITKVYLAYFLSENYTPYIYPVYIFEGDSFIGLVSAIEDKYIAPE